MEFHEVANLFPMMDDDAFTKICRDIAKNGLIEPIWTYEGKIIDGRNRFKACEATKCPPKFREWDGKGSLVGFVISLNLNRRHLTTGQKAAIAVQMVPMLAAEAKERQRANGGDRKSGEYQKSNDIKRCQPVDDQAKSDRSTRTAHIAGNIVGVSGAVVERMKKVTDEAPELAEEVKQGGMTVNQAYKEIKERKEIKQASELGKPDPDRQVRVHSTAMQFSHIAISQLTRIREDDPQRVAALTEVLDYINEQLKGA